jgi:Tfp pilus assembly PilM family ATPase
LGRLADELRRVIAYYRDHTSHIHGASAVIGSILLSGGDANLYGLDTFFASQIKIPVQIADPFSAIRERLEYVVPSIPRNQALAFTAAIGLAMRGL